MKDIIAFSAIKTFYDSERDLLDIVCGFVLHQINKNANNADILKTQIKKEFALDIPLDIIRSALKRLRNKHKFIDCAEGYAKVVLTRDGEEEQRNNSTSVEQTRKQYNNLLLDIKTFLERKGETGVSLQSARDLLKAAILNNPSGVFKFAFPDTPTIQAQTRALNLIGEYIIEQEKTNSDKFEVLKSIIYCNILASALESGRVETIGNLNKLIVYLDSNIIFSLLELDDDFHNKAVAEMLQVFKDFSVKLRIFPFTLDEVKNKLFSYSGKYHAYANNIEVDSIYFRIKAKGFKETDILLLIDGLENSLAKFGVIIDYSARSFELTDFDRNLIPELTQEKEKRAVTGRNANQTKSNHKHPATIEHDLLSIRSVREIRGNFFEKIELAKAVFLTADVILAKFDYEKYGHFERQTIPEVLFRTQLVNFLWFKNPTVSALLPIRDLMSGYIRTKMVSERLWDTFIWELKKQVEQNKYTKEDIATLVSLSETRSVLTEIQRSSQDYSEEIRKKIIDSGLIEEAKKVREESVRLKKYKKETENVLEDKNEQIEQVNQSLVRITQSIEKSCIKRWSRVFNGVVSTVFMFLACITFYFIYKLGFEQISSYLGLLPLGFLSFILICLLKKKEVRFLPSIIAFRVNLENKMVLRCVEYKKKDFGITR